MNPDVRIDRVVMAGGGTGGHLYPGIAVAREILRRHVAAAISFAGTSRGLESRIVPREGFALDCIRSAGLKGKSWGARLSGAAQVPLGLIDAWRLLSRRRPQVVVGLGGYSSGPVVLLAALRRVPTVVLEQNAAPGLANRLLARWVRAAAVAYEEALPHFRGKGFVTGNPVRPEFLDAVGVAAAEPTAADHRLLVLGGSQGARALNRAVVAAGPSLAAAGASIVHQAGSVDLAEVTKGHARAGVPARTEAFLDPVAPEMAAATLIVCRAGATTLAELAALGRPAVLIPFAAATDDHQRRNAEVVARAGAAVVIEERDLSGDRLARTVVELLGASGRLAAMGRAMRGFARPDAAARIVDRIEALVTSHG